MGFRGIGKAALVLSAISFGGHALASVEVVCSKEAIRGGEPMNGADENVINEKIRRLEREGKVVEITHLATSTGISVSKIDKTCVTLKY